MAESNTIDILKGAILLEHRGKALYESVVKSSGSDDVKQLFSMLSKEEDRHISVLNKQFSLLSKGESFDLAELEAEHATTYEAIISDEIVKSISGAGYEAAVIAAALEFEKRAVEFYSQHASDAASEDEKKLYDWLAGWEKNHMQMLARLDNELKEKIWFDNQFWPF